MLVVAVNIPLIIGLVTSLKTNADISQNPLRLPTHFTLDHYLRLNSNPQFDFWKYITNSISLSTGAMVLTALLGVPATHGIVVLRIGGSRLLALVTSLRVVPAIMMMLPLFIMFTKAGLIDSIWALIFANTILQIPLVVLIYAAGMRSVPDSILDAARIDGAGELRVLLRIVLPIIRPSIASAALLTFVFAWSEYLFGLVLTTDSAVPLTVGVSNFVTNTGTQWGDLSATVIVSIIPTLLVAIFAQKHLVGGLTAGAMSGV